MRKAIVVLIPAVALLCMGKPSARVAADGGTQFDRIEEDWQLVVGNPDQSQNGPQITTSMSPSGNYTSDAFVAFDLNYREYPSFQVGGMQTQVWQNKQLLASSSQGSAQFNTANETLTWTQFMSVNDGQITYGINNGQSTTFGRFGQGNGLLTVSFNGNNGGDLSGYTPASTVAHSGATFESNHVTSMSLIRVRYYSNGQLVSTDSTQRDVILPP